MYITLFDTPSPIVTVPSENLQPNGTFEPWGEWSECSKTCHKGKQARVIWTWMVKGISVTTAYMESTLVRRMMMI